MKTLKACGIMAAGLVCLAVTAQASTTTNISVTNAPSDTGWVETATHASSHVAMNAGVHGVGEYGSSALFRWDLSAYTNYHPVGGATLYVYMRSKQSSTATFDLYKVRQSEVDWDGDAMGGGGGYDPLNASGRNNAIGDGSIGSGDFSSVGFVAVSVSQSALIDMVQNGATDRGVMLDNGNTVNNTRAYLNGIAWGDASLRPYLVMTVNPAETVAPSDTGHIETGGHASSSTYMDAGWHASPGEDKHSAVFRFDLSSYNTPLWEVLGDGMLFVYSREKQPNAATFNLYKLRQSADDWDGNSMGGPSTPDWDTIGTTERQNAINDGSIGSGDFSGTGFRRVTISKAAIEAMISNGADDRGVMLDNGNTVANTRVYLNGIAWGDASLRPYLVFPAFEHPEPGTMVILR